MKKDVKCIKCGKTVKAGKPIVKLKGLRGTLGEGYHPFTKGIVCYKCFVGHDPIGSALDV